MEGHRRSVLGGSDEDHNRSVLGGSEYELSRSVLGGSEEYFSRSLLGGSDEVMPIHCEPCKKEGNTVEAVKHCKDCAEYLCGQCYKSHTKFKAFQNHVTNDLDDVNDVINKSIKKTITETVDNFPSKVQSDQKCDLQTSKPTNSSMETVRKVTAKRLTSINISTRGDKQTPYIQDLTIARIHYCIVTDDYNKSIKVIDVREMCVTCEIYISEAVGLYAITTVNDDNVAVSVKFKDGQKLLFLSLSTSGVISNTDKSLVIESNYLGLVYDKGHFYATNSSGIHVISMDGQIVRTINNSAFGGLYGIALNKDHNTIYVCSRFKDTVFSADLEGNIRATYKGEDMKRPDGVTVDSEGYVYVCSSDTRCVHQLTADLKKVQVIISEVFVRRCTFNRAENRLYLAFCDKIEILDTKYD